jgi:predicted DNA-binding transcriptional regulator AlpA
MPEQTAPTRLIPLAEVCPRIGVSLRTGYRWVQDDKFPIDPIRVGTKIMFRPAQVEEFIGGLG